MAIVQKQVSFIGMKELQRAIRRNPAVVLSESRKFLTRGLAEYKRGIINSPWRIGSLGGGSPVSAIRGGNLRDTHKTDISGLTASIGPTAGYAAYVHDGTFKMEARPWLEYVQNQKNPAIEKHYRVMLNSIIRDLAK